MTTEHGSQKLKEDDAEQQRAHSYYFHLIGKLGEKTDYYNSFQGQFFTFLRNGNE